MTVDRDELSKLGFDDGPALDAALDHVARENLSGLDLMMWAAEELEGGEGAECP